MQLAEIHKMPQEVLRAEYSIDYRTVMRDTAPLAQGIDISCSIMRITKHPGETGLCTCVLAHLLDVESASRVQCRAEMRSSQWLTEGGNRVPDCTTRITQQQNFLFSRHVIRPVSESESHSTTNHHIATARHKSSRREAGLFHVVAVWEPTRSGLSVTGQDEMQMELTTALLDLSTCHPGLQTHRRKLQDNFKLPSAKLLSC
jgi:hypothetical protein